MHRYTQFSIVSVGLITCCLARGAVVINEVFYRPPDDIPKLQWIELHNPDREDADLSGWKLTGGVTFTFAPGTRLAAGEYTVLCQDEKRFHEYYSTPVLGEFKGSLSGSGRRIELFDRSGRVIDRVKFETRAPWPVAADGYTASLERISPGADGAVVSNWTASPTSSDESWPAGSPGAKNHSYCDHLPPVVTSLTFSPDNPKPGEPIEVRAVLDGASAIEKVELRFRTVKPGAVSEESVLAMSSSREKTYTASIPPQAAGALVRFRVRAVDPKGAERFYPAGTEIRPALSFMVQGASEMGAIPLAYVVSTDPRDVADSALYLQRSKLGLDNPFHGGQHSQALGMVDSGLDLASAWTELTIRHAPDLTTFKALRKIFVARAAERQQLIEEVSGSQQIEKVMERLPGQIAAMQRAWTSEISQALPPDQREGFGRWVEQQISGAQQGPEGFFRRFVKIEGVWMALNQRFEVDDAAVTALRPVLKKALDARSMRNPALQNLEPGPGGFPKLQAAFGAAEDQMWKEMSGILTFPQMRYARQWIREHGSFIRPRLTEVRPLAPSGPSAFIVVDPETKKAEVFDFVNVTERSAGFKVRFHKDHTYRGIQTMNLMFEYNDRFVLAEPLAYDFYQRVGAPSPERGFFRLSLDGQTIGYHLWTEQISGSFLRRQRRDPNGDLYKLAWYGRSIESQHEKPKRPETGHADLVQLIDRLNATKGDQQWAVIEKNFNVGEVLNYFAVNMCLSHWDGFFNNYFAYHDRRGTGKWEMYPWDQDKTWGFYDSIKPGEVFYDMPLTFGMEGDTPPGGGPARFDPSSWWRPGGFFSKPLLANPEFRRLFLARVREIVETQFKPEVMFPVIDDMARRLRPEVPLRAAALREDPAVALKRLDENIASLKENLVKRREFLLKQAELK